MRIGIFGRGRLGFALIAALFDARLYFLEFMFPNIRIAKVGGVAQVYNQPQLPIHFRQVLLHLGAIHRC